MFEKKMTAKAVNTKNRRLPFSGAKNFRDLGGYPTANGKTLRWGMLYRSDGLHTLTNADQKLLSTLSLDRIIDFRAGWEKENRSDRLPVGMNIRQVEIPILDSSTEAWHNSNKEMAKGLKKTDPYKHMIQTNIELGTRFTPEMKKFMQEVFSAQGKPVLFHCSAGKDRTGFASAILLRMLGVSQETIMEDYLLTNQYLIPGYRWNLLFVRLMWGKLLLEKVKGFLAADPSYLSAAFEAIDREYGSFDNYIRDGLGLGEEDIERLKLVYLE
ncbi:MAG: tyrosine-protein phosphatase [Anaerolineales bacterium]|nr:tyrosine-protein phosphatase [Anaerolineales bacterium]